MTKAQTFEKRKTKNQNMGVKDGLVAKKKSQKLKGTPTGKMNVVNKKNKQNGKKTNGSSKSTITEKKNQSFNKDKLKVKSESESDDEDLDSENDNESMEDSDAQSVTVKSVERKGVNMFNGIKAEKDDSEDECEAESGDSEEEDDDDEEDLQDESTGLKALLGESIGDDDDDDDDFNEDDESDEDDDISEEDDVVDKEVKLNKIQKELEASSDDEDDEDDEDEDDEDDEEDDEDEDDKDEKVGLKALLGESLVDDENDMDFKEDDDDDDDDDDDVDEDEDEDEDEENLESDDNEESIEESKSPVKKSKKEVVIDSPTLTAEQKAKVIYVGNIPKSTTPNEIKKIFKSCGEIESIRIRGVVPEDIRMSPKVATITKKMHPKLQSIYAYVVFKEKSSVKEALKLNGHKLGENTLRIDLSTAKQHDGKKAVFIGNLAFEITDDEVRNHFVSCGKIESVRLIRDRKTGLGLGIGYVNFVNEDSVTLALQLNNTTLNNREIRVQNYSSEKTSTKRNRRKSQKQNKLNESRKKFKNNTGKGVVVQNKINKSSKKKQRSQGEAKREKSNESSSPAKASFQGQTSEKKKKSKIGKLNKKRKIMAEKLTSSRKTD